MNTLKSYGHRRIAFLRLHLPGENLTSIRGFTTGELLDFYRANDLDDDKELLYTAGNSQLEIDAIVKKWNCSNAFDVEDINVESILSEVDYIIENKYELSACIEKTTNLMKDKNVCDAKSAIELMEF